MVVREDDGAGVFPECFFDHLPRIHACLRERATEHVYRFDEPILRVEEEHHEHFVLKTGAMSDEVVTHRLWRIETPLAFEGPCKVVGNNLPSSLEIHHRLLG